MHSPWGLGAESFFVWTLFISGQYCSSWSIQTKPSTDSPEHAQTPDPMDLEPLDQGPPDPGPTRPCALDPPNRASTRFWPYLTLDPGKLGPTGPWIHWTHRTHWTLVPPDPGSTGGTGPSVNGASHSTAAAAAALTRSNQGEVNLNPADASLIGTHLSRPRSDPPHTGYVKHCLTRGTSRAYPYSVMPHKNSSSAQLPKKTQQKIRSEKCVVPGRRYFAFRGVGEGSSFLLWKDVLEDPWFAV